MCYSYSLLWVFQPDDVIVLLTAFSQTAKCITDGILLGTSKRNVYQGLGSEKINTLLSRFSKLRLVIMDEVSMVGVDMIYYIHRRLEDIMGTAGGDTVFGNISILAVRDLYKMQLVGQNLVFGLPSDAWFTMATTFSNGETNWKHETTRGSCWHSQKSAHSYLFHCWYFLAKFSRNWARLSYIISTMLHMSSKQTKGQAP